MNYVTLNGVKSTTIKGLLIQSLPSISKPLMRTEVEEIDGRDGDIVTKLGYSAYNKEIEIGLYGDYDVDKVIAFFDSEGQVTFSNEPDKYYNYQIIDQIDFERLIRFKTATVTFHVQPFKYSNVERELTRTNQLLTFRDYEVSKNGVAISAQDGSISVKGTATTATEIYMPIDRINLSAGNYTLEATAIGTAPESCSIRLIHDTPSNVNSFGGTYATLKEGTVNIYAGLSDSKSYNYLYFYITSGQEMSFTFNLSLSNDNFDSISVTNTGNTIAKPIITLYGSGIIDLSLNGQKLFVIDLSEDDEITIDTALMEAYSDSILKNRKVAGDYDNFNLKIGVNNITWLGTVTKITLNNYSRWI